MILKTPKTCNMCGLQHFETPESARFDKGTETYFWECQGTYQGDTCNSTMVYMPDFERTLALIVAAHRKENGGEK